MTLLAWAAAERRAAAAGQSGLTHHDIQAGLKALELSKLRFSEAFFFQKQQISHHGHFQPPFKGLMTSACLRRTHPPGYCCRREVFLWLRNDESSC